MGRLIACFLTCLLLFSACTYVPAVPPEPIPGVDGLMGDETNPASPIVEGFPDEVLRISFAAVGDNLVHPCIYIDARNRAEAGGRAYNFKPAFRDRDAYRDLEDGLDELEDTIGDLDATLSLGTRFGRLRKLELELSANGTRVTLEGNFSRIGTTRIDTDELDELLDEATEY